MVSKVDAHHHYWEAHAVAEHEWRSTDLSVLDGSFLPRDLEPLASSLGITQTVVIQSADTPRENDRLHQFAATTPSIGGVVGYLPVQDPRAARAELERANIQWWCGTRCLIADDPLDWLNDSEVVDLFRGLAEAQLAWDVVVINSGQAEAVAALAAAVPELRIMVDHLARPPMGEDDAQTWKQRVSMLADQPNIALKVSVGINALTATVGWDPSVLEPSVHHAVETFGPDRLMLASNWPVSLIGVDYVTAWQDLSSLLAGYLSENELTKVQGLNAETWYCLEARTS